MKKYLVRGGADPLINYRPKDVLIRNYIGGNSGNMLFLYGVINELTTDGAVCEITNRKSSWSDAEIERINGEYDAVILPMADAFRADYISTLNSYTDFIKKLRIPCVVTGVGLRAELEPDLKAKRPFDDDVRRFVKGVLDHSSKLGLRGEFTAEYLRKLGFTPDRDFTVIGCPSLYMHGMAIEQKEPDFHKIGINLNAIAPAVINEAYINLIRDNANVHIIQQRQIEFVDWFYGKSVDLSTFVPEYARRNIFSEFDFKTLKRENRVHFFLNVPSWIEFMRSFDVFIGCRFHGIAAAILAGVPSAITAIDSRTRELAMYHCIPQLTEEELRGKPLSACMQNIDYSQFHKQHGRNLEHYISFLTDNGLQTGYTRNNELTYGSSVLERSILEKGHASTVYTGFDACGIQERLRREMEYGMYSSIAGTKRRIKSMIQKAHS